MADLAPYSEDARATFGMAFDACKARGMETPFIVCCVSTKECCAMRLTGLGGPTELPVMLYGPQTISIPLTLMVVDPRNVAAVFEMEESGTISPLYLPAETSSTARI